MQQNFLTHLVTKPPRESTLLDLLFVNREGLVDDVMVGGCLGHSKHKTVRVLSCWRRGGSAELPPWTSSRQTLVLFQRLANRVLWERPRSLGRLDTVQEGNLQGAGTGLS